MLLLLQLNELLTPPRGAAPPQAIILGESVVPMGRHYGQDYRYRDSVALQPLALLMELGEITEDEFAALAVMM